MTLRERKYTVPVKAVITQEAKAKLDRNVIEQGTTISQKIRKWIDDFNNNNKQEKKK